jgi:hypothetical protein
LATLERELEEELLDRSETGVADQSDRGALAAVVGDPP